MVRILIQRLGYYLLQKGENVAYLIIFLFFCCVITYISLIEYQEQESPQYYHTNIENTRKEILELFRKYELKSKCKKELCLRPEIQELTKLNRHIEISQKLIQKIQAKPSNAIYAMHFICKNINCYNFIRDIEIIPNIFILKAQSFDTEIIKQSDANHTDSRTMLSDKINSSKLQWNQQILLLFELQQISREQYAK
ncbi:hypothetical protein LS73_001160 [Helicobacter muridarum]|nr:hypothetical protein [Helicobacter muridarum]TLE01324.1 hypothetical protein LS73_001160 [Helicobacter muridarum]